MADHYYVTYTSYNNWKIPVNLALGFHLLFGAAMIFLPNLLQHKSKFEDTVTVSLVNISEPIIEQPASPPNPPPEPAEVKKAVSINEPVKQVPIKKVVKAVSIKPLKRKIKKKIVKKKNIPDREKEIAELKRKRLAEALKAEKQAAEQSRRAAEEAYRQQKMLERQLDRIRREIKSPTKTAAKSGGKAKAAQSAVENQYYANVISHITSFYSLPEFSTWDPKLLARVSVKINKTGTIVRQHIEQRSGNATFDQFVIKTVQNANPLPPIPAAIKYKSLTFDLRFSPGSIHF